MGDVIGKLLDPLEAAGFAWKAEPDLVAEVKETLVKALAWADDATLAKAAEWVILNRKFRSMPMPADLVAAVKAAAPRDDARSDGPAWGEALRDRIRNAHTPQDVAAIWQTAVKPMRSKVDRRIWGFVRWWVHWRMKDFASLRSRVPRKGGIAEWTDEWWEPLPPRPERKGKTA